MKGVIFENNQRSFNSKDHGFYQIGFVEIDRIALDPVRAEIAGGHPIIFPAQEGERELTLAFHYVGDAYRSDILRFANALHSRRIPYRMILEEENDRYYVVFITQAPTTAMSESVADAEVTVALARNYALRRWCDCEITPDNTEITMNMPIVPVKFEYNLTGSSIVIPYYNEGIELPPVLEIEGVDYPQIIAGNTAAHYAGRISNKLRIDFEHLLARENGTRRDTLLFGGKVLIPHGAQDLRLHYQKLDEFVFRYVQQSRNSFGEGTLENLQLTGDEEQTEGVKTYQYGAPMFSRSSVGYDGKTEEVGDGVPRFFPGKFDQALLIEQAVTQEFANAEIADLTNWVNSGITLTGESEGVANIVHGSAADGSQRVYLRQDVSVVEGETITIQVDQRLVGSCDHSELRISWYDTNGASISNDTKDVTAELSSDWKTLFLTATAPTGAVEAQSYVLYDGGTQQQNFEVEATRPMFTKTSHVWSWHKSGTKAAETLKVQDNTMFNESEGVLGVWVYEDGTGREGFIWDTDSPRFLFFRYGGDGTYNLWINGSNVFGDKGVPTPSVGWHYWELRWNGSTVELYLDGQIAKLEDGSDARNTSATVDFGFTTFYIGNDNSGGRQWNALIDDLRISSESRSGSEIYDPNSGEPQPLDEKTAYYVDFDGVNYASAEDQEQSIIVARNAGLYTSPEISISTSRAIRKALLEFDKTANGAAYIDYRLNTSGTWGDWEPVGFNRKIPDITPETDLSNAKFQYRALLKTYDVAQIHRLQQVALTLSSERSGKVTIMNRKRLV